MAIIESTGGTAMVVDAAFGAARVSIRPPEALAWLSVGAQTGALTGVAANGALFSFRNLSSNPVMIRRVGIGFVTTTAFTAAQMLSWGLQVARGFTVSDSGGTAIALTGSNAKHRTSLGTLTSVDCRVATTAALTAGTKVLDTNTVAQVGARALRLIRAQGHRSPGPGSGTRHKGRRACDPTGRGSDPARGVNGRI